MATVDVIYNNKNDETVFEVVLGNRKQSLNLGEAAKLAADLTTAIAFVINPDSIQQQHPVTKAKQVQRSRKPVAAAVPAENTSEPLEWHRVGTGASRYRANWLGTTVETFKNATGWNIKVGGKIVNDAPISSKRAAVEFVETMRVTV